MSYSTVDQCTKQKPCDKYTLGGFGNYAVMRAEYLPETKIRYIYEPVPGRCCPIDKYKGDWKCDGRGGDGKCDNASGMSGHMSLEQVKYLKRNKCLK
jgi:hypothetical protein